MATLFDIAQITGFSQATVQRVLEGRDSIGQEARNRIFLAAKLTGFKYGKAENDGGAKEANSKLIGVIAEKESFTNGLEHPLFGGIVNSFRNIAYKDGYDLIFMSKEMNSSISYIDHCKSRKVEGILILNSVYGDPEITSLASSGIPCVSANEFIPGICTVVSENKDAAFHGVEYLIEKGHKNIGYIAGPYLVNSPAAIERGEGYKMAIKAAGLKYKSEYVEKAALGELKPGFEAAKKLFTRAPEITAVFCASDQLAAGTMQYLQTVGKRVPDDVSLIGFDDSLISECSTPPLTTFRQDRKKIAAVCAEKLMAAMKGKGEYEIVRIPVQFIERESVAAVRKA